MEEERNSSLKPVIITLLVVAVLAMGGYIVYDKVIRKEENNSKSNTSDQIKDNIVEEDNDSKSNTSDQIKDNIVEEDNDSKSNTSDQIKDNTSGKIVETADERYQKYLTNLKNKVKEYEKKRVDGPNGSYQNAITKGKFMLYDYLNDNDTYITYKLLNGQLNFALYENNKQTKTYSVDNNVLMVNVSITGNGGLTSIDYVKNDGVLYRVFVNDTIENNKVKIDKLNYKNIVNIINGEAGTVFIDIDGNIYYGA